MTPLKAGEQDLVLFAVKMYHNAEAAASLAPMMGPNTVVLTLQNGIDNGETLAEVVGESHVMIGSAYMEGRDFPARRGHPRRARHCGLR